LSSFHTINSITFFRILAADLRHPVTKLSPQHDNLVNHISEASITPTYSTVAIFTVVDVNRVNIGKEACSTHKASVLQTADGYDMIAVSLIGKRRT
jgi:hypothetical protein